MRRNWLAALGVALLVMGTAHTLRGDDKRPTPSFGALETMSPEAARAKALAWLKEVGKTDPQTTQRAEAIWAQEERPVLDRLADTFTLGCHDAAKLMADAQDPLVPMPQIVPDVLKNPKCSAFFRNNLGLAYARALSIRRGHDEALLVLKAIPVEQVAVPATYLFTRAVCEHATLQRTEATRSIVRLLEDGAGAPERYRTVSALMLLDMQTWKEKDLGAVARKMNVIGERLDVAKGGPQTQKLQKEVILRLDELIKELENKAKGGS